MPCHGTQTLINIIQIKSEPITSNSPRVMSKLIEDQSCKCNDKKFKLFVKKLSFSWSKNGFFISCIRELLRLNVLCRIDPPWAINQKILPGPNRVKRKTKIEKSIHGFK